MSDHPKVLWKASLSCESAKKIQSLSSDHDMNENIPNYVQNKVTEEPVEIPIDELIKNINNTNAKLFHHSESGDNKETLFTLSSILNNDGNNSSSSSAIISASPKEASNSMNNISTNFQYSGSTFGFKAKSDSELNLISKPLACSPLNSWYLSNGEN